MTYSRNRLSSKKPSPHMTNSTPKPETPDSENSGGSRSRDRYSGPMFSERPYPGVGRRRPVFKFPFGSRSLLPGTGPRLRQKRLQHPSPCAPWPECEGYKSYGLGTGGAPAAGLLHGTLSPRKWEDRVVSSVGWGWDHVVLHVMWPHYTSAFKSKKCVKRRNYAQYIFSFGLKWTMFENV